MYKQFLSNYTKQYDPTDRLKLEKIINDNNLPEGASYCFLREKWDVYYYKWLGRYLLNTKDTDVRVIDKEEQLNDIEAEYVVVEDMENSIIIDWIMNNYPDQVGSEVIIRNDVQ